jgi:hypothetical protein
MENKEMDLVEVGPLQKGKRDGAWSKRHICGSTSHSISYSPPLLRKREMRERTKENFG